jgi:hypothetical protein
MVDFLDNNKFGRKVCKAVQKVETKVYGRRRA